MGSQKATGKITKSITTWVGWGKWEITQRKHMNMSKHFCAKVAEQCVSENLLHKSLCTPAVSLGIIWIKHNNPEYLTTWIFNDKT